MRAVEETRRRLLSARISVLFVGESASAGGTFFYDANSNLYEVSSVNAVLARFGPDEMESGIARPPAAPLC